MSERITDTSVLQRVNECINKSTETIEKICPKNNITLGISIRDNYHRDGETPRFSMMTACQMLWAITTSGKYSKAHYLTDELLTLINNDLSNSYLEKRDRAYEKAFLLIATTSAGQSIKDTFYIAIVKNIIDSQKENGSWSSYKGGNSDLRATALNVVALSECMNYVGKTNTPPFSDIEFVVKKACNWIQRQYKDGYCERIIDSLPEYSSTLQRAPGIELTAWCTYALIIASDLVLISDDIQRNDGNQYEETIRKSILWLTTHKIDRVAETPEIEPEYYIPDLGNPDKIIKHGYGSGSLEILICALIAYRKSKLYRFVRNYEDIMRNFVVRLMDNMNPDGEWLDKNTGSYITTWPVSYALRALSLYHEYIIDKLKFKSQFKQNLKIYMVSIPSYLWKYRITVVCLSFTLLLICFSDVIKANIEYFNSPVASAIGLILSVIGFFQGMKK